MSSSTSKMFVETLLSPKWVSLLFLLCLAHITTCVFGVFDFYCLLLTAEKSKKKKAFKMYKARDTAQLVANCCLGADWRHQKEQPWKKPPGDTPEQWHQSCPVCILIEAALLWMKDSVPSDFALKCASLYLCCPGLHSRFEAFKSKMMLELLCVFNMR